MRTATIRHARKGGRHANAHPGAQYRENALSKMGSRLLRQTLYMAALTAWRHNPIIRALGQRLQAKGKGGKRAVAAATRKLVRLIYGVLKQAQRFDPNWTRPNRRARKLPNIGSRTTPHLHGGVFRST